MSPESDELRARTPPSRGGGGASGFADIEHATSLATKLSAQGGLPVDATAAEFARLLALDGISLYLQVAAPTAGAKLSLVPDDSARATLCVPEAFCCGAGRPTNPGHTYVMVLWCQNVVDQRFEATCPTFVRRITVVTNGRLLAIEPDDLPLTLDLT